LNTDGLAYIQDGELYFYVTKRVTGRQMTARCFDNTAARFAEQEKYAEIFETNKQMTKWLIHKLDALRNF
jgi:hypothetical protein